ENSLTLRRFLTRDKKVFHSVDGPSNQLLKLRNNVPKSLMFLTRDKSSSSPPSKEGEEASNVASASKSCNETSTSDNGNDSRKSLSGNETEAPLRTHLIRRRDK
ncbi:hypothetical protein HAX54_039465, partial [Datura stramonium]|nr:hypothetical protein [Datura stramonium]